MNKTPRFNVMMAYLKAVDQHDTNVDNSQNQYLIDLFEKHKEVISDWFEDCVPTLEKGWNPNICSRAEWHGQSFHKSFRQICVCNNTQDDVTIWKLLAEGKTSFWDAHHESMKDFK